MSLANLIGIISGILGIISFIFLDDSKKIKSYVLFILIAITFWAGGNYQSLSKTKKKYFDLQLDNGRIKRIFYLDFENYKKIGYYPENGIYHLEYNRIDFGDEERKIILISKKTGTQYTIHDVLANKLVFSPNKQHFYILTRHGLKLKDEDYYNTEALNIYSIEDSEVNSVYKREYSDSENQNLQAVNWETDSSILVGVCNSTATRNHRMDLTLEASGWVESLHVDVDTGVKW
jgi:hypothetical protein